jgi:hypothetical protein
MKNLRGTLSYPWVLTKPGRGAGLRIGAFCHRLTEARRWYYDGTTVELHACCKPLEICDLQRYHLEGHLFVRSVVSAAPYRSAVACRWHSNL